MKKVEMELQEVESSMIASIGWKDTVLGIKFKGGMLYQFENVEKQVYDSLIKSESIGKAFSNKIKNKYSYSKFDEKIVINKEETK